MKAKLSTLKKKAWREFSKYIRLKYSENGYGNCYTCDVNKPWKELQAGHLVASRGHAVLFNEECVRPQCMPCNVFLNGNHAEYCMRMIDEVGKEKVEELLRLRHVPKKYTKAEVQEIYEKYRDLNKKLEE